MLTGSDPDGDTIAFTIAMAPHHGTLSGTAPNLTYTPAPDFHGVDSFTFTANDGHDESGPATVDDHRQRGQRPAGAAARLDHRRRRADPVTVAATRPGRQRRRRGRSTSASSR